MGVSLSACLRFAFSSLSIYFQVFWLSACCKFLGHFGPSPGGAEGIIGVRRWTSRFQLAYTSFSACFRLALSLLSICFQLAFGLPSVASSLLLACSRLAFSLLLLCFQLALSFFQQASFFALTLLSDHHAFRYFALQV